MMTNAYPEKCCSERVFEPADESAIAAFEKAIGKRLPEEYREFLAEWNGVVFYPEMRGFAAAFPTQPVEDHSDHVPQWSQWLPSSRRTMVDSIGDLALLRGLGPEPRYELSKDNPGYDFQFWAPPRFLAIGDHGDDIGRICISLDGHDRGQIYEWIWPEGTPEPGVNCPTMDFFRWIAADFKEFWDILRPMPEAEVRKWKRAFGSTDDDE